MDDNQNFVIGVQFTRLGKTYHFRANNDRDLKVNDTVLVETSRGLQLGRVIEFPDPSQNAQLQHIKSIIRKANEEDLEEQKKWKEKEEETTLLAKKCLNSHGFRNIKAVDSEYGYHGKNLTILISSTSDQKVNTNPIQELFTKEFPDSHITVRQVGPRDVAKIYGGIGACGLPERCCSQFLRNFSSISIKMAKTQEISLTPEEITGMCGRLRCCLMYEYKQYEEGRKGLPKKNKWVETPEGVGRVSVVLPLRGSILVYIPNTGVKEFSADEVTLTQRPTQTNQQQQQRSGSSRSGSSRSSRSSNSSKNRQSRDKSDSESHQQTKDNKSSDQSTDKQNDQQQRSKNKSRKSSKRRYYNRKKSRSKNSSNQNKPKQSSNSSNNKPSKSE